MPTETTSLHRVSSALKHESLLPTIIILLLLQKGTWKTVTAGSCRAAAARRLLQRLQHPETSAGSVSSGTLIFLWSFGFSLMKD